MDPVAGVYDTPSPALSVQLLVVFGVIGVVAWIVTDVGLGHTTSGEAMVAHVVILLVFGACIVAGALLS